MEMKEISKIIFLSLILISCWGFISALYYISNSNAEERNIIVINKTTKLVPHGFSSATEYLILGDDGNVYHTKDWKIYYSMKIGKRYNVKAINLYGWGYPSNYWIIEEVEEIQNKTNEKEI